MEDLKDEDQDRIYKDELSAEEAEAERSGNKGRGRGRGRGKGRGKGRGRPAGRGRGRGQSAQQNAGDSSIQERKQGGAAEAGNPIPAEETEVAKRPRVAEASNALEKGPSKRGVSPPCPKSKAKIPKVSKEPAKEQKVAVSEPVELEVRAEQSRCHTLSGCKEKERNSAREGGPHW